MDSVIDVLVPTRDRPAELATTLAGLAAQESPPFRVVISDQSDLPMGHAVLSMVRALRRQGVPVSTLRNMPRRGMAHQRDFLLRQSASPYVIYLDDDVWLANDALQRLHTAIESLDCGLVGFAMQRLSYLADDRPAASEHIKPERWTLHNPDNPTHSGDSLGLRQGEWRTNKIAWIGGCALFSRSALEAVGGFSFWKDVPEDLGGEDVVAQQRVMARFGGAGILPSAAVHLGFPTSAPSDRIEAPNVIYGVGTTHR
jgi:GT2 family glycosyltransferase